MIARVDHGRHLAEHLFARVKWSAVRRRPVLLRLLLLLIAVLIAARRARVRLRARLRRQARRACGCGCVSPSAGFFFRRRLRLRFGFVPSGPAASGAPDFGRRIFAFAFADFAFADSGAFARGVVLSA